MSDIKKNDIVLLDITAVSNLGYGVGRTDNGKVVFTPGTVTGERVEVKIIKITKGYLVGKLQKRETFSVAPRPRLAVVVHTDLSIMITSLN